MKNFILSLSLCFALAACGTSPKNVVAALEEGLAATDRLAVEYVSLPDCDDATAVKPFCSEDQVVLDIEQAKNIAKAAVFEAEAAVLDASQSDGAIEKAVIAATRALAALRNIIPSLTGGAN